MSGVHKSQIVRGETDSFMPYVPGVNCSDCGRFVGRDGYIGIDCFEMSSRVASVEGQCRRCLEHDTEANDTCAGCGDVAEHWRDGGYFCTTCAACEVCQSPYCTEEAHRA